MVRKLITATFVALSLLTPGLAQERDRVFLIKGVTATGKIESITRDQVAISVKGNTQKYATNEIAKIVFDDEPTAVENARNFINNRQFNQAETELNKLGEQKMSVLPRKSNTESPGSGQDGFGRNGKSQDRTTLLSDALKANPDSHHAYQGAELMGDLAMLLGVRQRCHLHNQIAQAPFPELKALAAYKLGDVALTANKLPDARKQFELLMNAKATDAETTRLRSLAEVGWPCAKPKKASRRRPWPSCKNWSRATTPAIRLCLLVSPMPWDYATKPWDRMSKPRWLICEPISCSLARRTCMPKPCTICPSYYPK